ncbi:hypothetical protein Ga0080559_TMP466 (plasmid) [Salipiger profundus]|uniref:Uncharacterized protein n=1 Tax=Salipiger profundus TaxID=1229727 RepID=A0A1U7DCT2_9RHOB|nr:hypothetical protein Ga0080559_TMP466 [Salipiger profundus]
MTNRTRGMRNAHEARSHPAQRRSARRPAPGGTCRPGPLQTPPPRRVQAV